MISCQSTVHQAGWNFQDHKRLHFVKSKSKLNKLVVGLAKEPALIRELIQLPSPFIYHCL